MFPGSTPRLDLAIGVRDHHDLHPDHRSRGPAARRGGALHALRAAARADHDRSLELARAAGQASGMSASCWPSASAPATRAQRRGRTRHDFLTWMRIGVPISPNDSRSRFAEKPLVGEVELGRDVGEEHERRRRDARLRRVEDPHVPLAGARGRVHGGDGLDEPVELAGRDAAHARLGDLVDRLEHLRRALAGGRRDVQHRRVVEELQLPAQLLVELPREVRPAPFIRSHLLAAMMMPQPACSASPAIVAS